MMKLAVILMILACALSKSFAREDRDGKAKKNLLKPHGKNVCDYTESRPVQVNVSRIAEKFVRVRKRYVTTSWFRKVVRYRIVVRKISMIEYHMETRIRHFKVFYCCDGWTNEKESNECEKPVCGFECMNGGRCTAPNICRCARGFQGKFCQNDENECNNAFLNKCQQECINTRGSFECGCRSGFAVDPNDRTKCIDVNECATGSACRCQPNDANCEVACVNTKGSYLCYCKKGYRLGFDGVCRDINECIEDICSHSCINLPGSYKCSCFLGFDLNKTTGECTDIDECKIRNGGCSHKCHNVEGGFTCSCNEGYYLESDRTTCKRIPSSMKHDLICTDEAKNYKMLSCWPRKVKILHAFYGRVTPNVCQYKTFTTKQRCSYDGVTDLMAKRCNGRTSCFFDASASLFENFKDPCPGISKYLQVLAKCV
eukprot:Seg2425.5 transcript_id=Seg2425.5/GoldUCD/mRNA.D3Y31 product="von Willebrand factor C and EGF domain-containing protein" protein_id=Seg2425.5/GoldUCD/D3Y31